MKTVIVFFIITLISSYQVLAITPKIKYEREIQYQLDYMIREKAAADDLQRSMNASREHLQVWDVQEQIKRHIEETLWFEDAIRYKAQLHFEGAGILTDRYDMAKQAEADILPLVNSAINQVKIATALVKGKRNIRAQELIAMAYLEWYEDHVAKTLAVRDKIWGREQYVSPLYYYKDGLAIYNRAVKSIVWIKDVVDNLSDTRNSLDASTVRKKKERKHRDLDKGYRLGLLRAEEDRINEERQLLKNDMADELKTSNKLINSIAHTNGKDRALKLILELVKEDSVRRSMDALSNF